MNSDYIYEEKIVAKLIGGMFGAISAVMLITLIYQLTTDAIDDAPYIDALFIILFLGFFLLTLNFGRLIIRIDYRELTVRFGIFKKRVPWENIEDVYVDETTAIKYGGAGIRTARIKGEWVLVYNVIGGPRVVLKLRVGRYKKFVFSTKNPEEVINVIKGQLVLTK